MRFKVGFVVGCAAGFWAASKAAELQRLGVGPRRSGPPPVSEAVNAEKVKALSDLVRARLSDVLEGPLGDMARDRVTELIGAAGRR